MVPRSPHHLPPVLILLLSCVVLSLTGRADPESAETGRVRAETAEIEAQTARIEADVAKLEAENARLEEEIAELRRR